MRIKDIPENERPQEKLLYHGPGSLSTAELLALVIRVGNGGKSAVQLAEDVLAYSSKAGGGLLGADVRELTELDGIGTAKACSIVAAVELSKRCSEHSIRRVSGKNPDEIAQHMMKELRGEKQEHLIALLMNVKCEIESEVTISIGERSSTAIDPRDVFRTAVRRGACALILVHNHPSGDPAPSREDIEATRRIMAAGDTMNIPLLDHLIIGDKCYVSLRSEGMMEKVSD